MGSDVTALLRVGDHITFCGACIPLPSGVFDTERITPAGSSFISEALASGANEENTRAHAGVADFCMLSITLWQFRSPGQHFTQLRLSYSQ